ncbi:MAG TPA: YigZ family protein [Ohtaekwangia sp.]
MPVFSFHTIQQPAEGTYKEKGSKFLAFAYPVENESEIKERLDALKKKYFDARHHCYAWMLGSEKKRFRAFDDGEPNHSAGDPVLGQIRSKDLTHVLVVVVRYFGGVKLGVGGLISAYKAAAGDALNHAVIIEKEVTGFYTLKYDYDATPEVMKLIKNNELTIRSQDFAERCKLEVEISLRRRETFLDAIQLQVALGLKLEVTSVDDL